MGLHCMLKAGLLGRQTCDPLSEMQSTSHVLWLLKTSLFSVCPEWQKDSSYQSPDRQKSMDCFDCLCLCGSQIGQAWFSKFIHKERTPFVL